MLHMFYPTVFRGFLESLKNKPTFNQKKPCRVPGSTTFNEPQKKVVAPSKNLFLISCKESRAVLQHSQALRTAAWLMTLLSTLSCCICSKSSTWMRVLHRDVHQSENPLRKFRHETVLRKFLTTQGPLPIFDRSFSSNPGSFPISVEFGRQFP